MNPRSSVAAGTRTLGNARPLRPSQPGGGELRRHLTNPQVMIH